MFDFPTQAKRAFLSKNGITAYSSFVTFLVALIFLVSYFYFNRGSLIADFNLLISKSFSVRQVDVAFNIFVEFVFLPIIYVFGILCLSVFVQNKKVINFDFNLINFDNFSLRSRRKQRNLYVWFWCVVNAFIVLCFTGFYIFNFVKANPQQGFLSLQKFPFENFMYMFVILFLFLIPVNIIVCRFLHAFKHRMLEGEDDLARKNPQRIFRV